MSYDVHRLKDRRARGQWDRNTRMPVPPPPPGSTDCQFHIFADAARYPLQVEPEVGPPDATFADMQGVLAAMGFQRGVIVHSQRYETDHRLLIDTLSGLAPDVRRNFRATCIIKDSVPDAEMERLNALGVRGARFNIGKRYADSIDPAEVRRSMDRVREIGWHARLHISGADIEQWGDFLLSIRELRMVIDHMAHLQFALGVGQPAVLWIRERLANDPNWFLMLSNGPRDSAMDKGWDDAIPFARAFIDVAPDKLIWGSDWPHTGWRERPMMNDAELVELLYRYADHDQGLIRKILVDTPALLHGFQS